MKRCVEEHTVPSFGTIPVGSLWEDESPFVLAEHSDKFISDALPQPAEKPAKKAPARKFGEKKGGD